VGSNILLRTLFSNTISLSSSLNIRDKVTHTYRTNNVHVSATNEYRNHYLCYTWQNTAPLSSASVILLPRCYVLNLWISGCRMLLKVSARWSSFVYCLLLVVTDRQQCVCSWCVSEESQAQSFVYSYFQLRVYYP
jgi:hypothetical protein